MIDTDHFTDDTGTWNGLRTYVGISLGDERTVVIDLDYTVGDELPAGIESYDVTNLQIIGDLILAHMLNHHQTVDGDGRDVIGLRIRIHGSAYDNLHLGTREIERPAVEVVYGVG